MPIYKMEGKKDGLQKYRVRINRTDANGKASPVERVVYGFEAAKAVESELLREIGSASTSKMTISDLFDDYINNKKCDIRETTSEKSIRNLRLYVLSSLKDVKLDKINKQLMQGWKTELSGKQSEKTKKKLSLRTRQNIFSEFRALLNYAVQMDYISKNPLVSVGNFKDVYDFQKAEEKLNYYTPDQFLKYIAVARQNAVSLTDWGYYVFFCIAFYTGLRKGEINALKWTDIDNDILHVRRSVTQKLKGKSIVETPPKNKSSYRSIQMPKPLIEILFEHKIRQKQDESFNENYRICGGIKCLSDTGIANKNIKFAEEAGLAHIRIHDFRHSHASILVNEGINIQEIARRLGHTDIQITWNTYAHLYPREEERAIKILNEIV